MDGASPGAVTCGCARALDSSPVASPVTSPASGDFVKSCLSASIFAIYASRDASYRVFKGRSLCSVSDVDREKRRWIATKAGYDFAVGLSVSDETHRNGCVGQTPLLKGGRRLSKAVEPERQISGGFVRGVQAVIIIVYSTKSHEVANSASFFINWSISASSATFAISI